jgi:mRNA interferase MazF
MPTTIGFEFGDVVLVPFPFTDQTTTKKRPAAGVGEVAVQRWKEAGLLKPSVLKPLLATADRGLLIRKLGRLEEQDRDALRRTLKAILGE